MPVPMDAKGAYMFGYRDALAGYLPSYQYFHPFELDYLEGWEDGNGDVTNGTSADRFYFEHYQQIINMIIQDGYT